MSAHRSVTTLLLAATLGALGFGSASRCLAQYQPRTPTISPYLNLTRFRNGGLPNYYALVRPQIQQQQFNARARVLANAQQQELGRLQRDVEEGLAAPVAAATGGGSWFMVPGTQTHFLDTTHYYPTPIIRRGIR